MGFCGVQPAYVPLLTYAVVSWQNTITNTCSRIPKYENSCGVVAKRICAIFASIIAGPLLVILTFIGKLTSCCQSKKQLPDPTGEAGGDEDAEGNAITGGYPDPLLNPPRLGAATPVPSAAPPSPSAAAPPAQPAPSAAAAAAEVKQQAAAEAPVKEEAAAKEEVLKTSDAIARITAQGGVIGAWFKEYNSRFVAHGVVQQDAALQALSEQRIRCGEGVVRRWKKVEREVASQGDRTTQFLPDLDAEDIKTLEAVEKTYEAPLNLKITRYMGRPCLEDHNFGRFLEFREAVVSIAGKHSAAGKKCSYEAVTVAYDQRKAPENRMDTVLHRLYKQMQQEIISEKKAKLAAAIENQRDQERYAHELANTFLALVPEEQRREKTEKVKKEYSQKYQDAIEKLKREADLSLSSEDLKALWESVMSTRPRIKIHGNLLNSEIRTLYNCCHWGYAKHLAVFRGIDPAKDIRSFGTRDPSREVYLLGPFENGGEFFDLELNRPDTLVLAPQGVVEEYRKKNAGQSLPNLFAFEELSSEAAAFLRVPPRLRGRHIVPMRIED